MSLVDVINTKLLLFKHGNRRKQYQIKIATGVRRDRKEGQLCNKYWNQRLATDPVRQAMRRECGVVGTWNDRENG
jgi:ubiquinone biosynthesis protein Coq4